MSLRRHPLSIDLPSARALPKVEERVEACLENPEVSLAELQDEQRRIADELEETFRVYDRKLQGAAKRIASLGADSLTPKEWERLRSEQLELWRLLRRAQAAQRSTRALAREVQEWREAEGAALPEGHPDHPETRAEIVESELRVRGVFASVPRLAAEPLEEEVEDALRSAADAGDGVEEVLTDASEDRASVPEWADAVTDDTLLREIHAHERELARTDAPGDLADLVRGLRDLHAHLRLHDRAQGRPRVRFTLGFPTPHH